MIVEQRTYRFHPGAVPRFMELYDGDVQALQARILGNLIGYFTIELGTLNQTVHLWGYDSLDDRAVRRAALMVEPDWRAFLAKVLPMLVSQESCILMPTRFSPIGAQG